MRIDGGSIAHHILNTLTDEVVYFKKHGVTPTLAVILVGDNPSSLSYIRQKRKAAETIGARLIFEQLPAETTTETLASAIAHYNDNPSVHGIIIQRPVPIPSSGLPVVLDTVIPDKDVDGLIPSSPFTVPVAKAVLVVLEHVHADLLTAELVSTGFVPWLQSQRSAIIGRGETAGRPIAKTLEAIHCTTSIIHSQTQRPEDILKGSTLIISCTGKKRVLTKKNVSQGTIVIGVGLGKDEGGSIHGEYDEDEMKHIASFYTPTPGGVGPVNVACLMHNLLEATRRQTL